uniref:Kelch domain-containing protein 10 n=2 Tax=Hirondellea gigas TaxID=1518452 RepID=A0A2P2I7Q2_9CRUS
MRMTMAESVNDRLCPIKPFKSMVVCGTPEVTKTLAEDQSAPLPRSGHRMICVGHKLFMFGGYNPNITEKFANPYWQLTKPLFAELWEYNTRSKQWRELYQCQMGRNHGLVSFGCVVSGHTMFHIGGTGLPFGECSNNWFYACDLFTGAWRKLHTTGKKPLRSYGMGLVLDGNDLYVVGGTTGFQYNLDVHHINIVDRVWSELPVSQGETPMARYRHEVLLHNGELVVFGGGQKDVTAPLDTLAAFDIVTRKWRYIHTFVDPFTQSYPKPRKCHVTVRYQDYVYIHGGCDEYHSFGDMWRMSLSTYVWQELPHGATSPRHFHSAAVNQDGCLYMHGGVDESGQRKGSLVSCWLTVPSLKRQCWFTMLQEWPHLLEVPPLSLYQLGLPTIDIRESELIPPPQPPPVFPPPQIDDDLDTDEANEAVALPADLEQALIDDDNDGGDVAGGDDEDPLSDASL